MSSNEEKPSVLFRILHFLVKDTGHAAALGDLEEIYAEMQRESGKLRARAWYIRQILLALPQGIKNNFYWSLTMFSSYFKTSFRNVKKHPVFSFINITGLAAGLCCFILLTLWVSDEMSFDRFHKNYHDIYRIYTVDKSANNVLKQLKTKMPLAPYLKEHYPEISEYARILYSSKGWKITVNGSSFLNETACWTDPGFFSVFTHRFIRGSAESTFKDAYSIILTERAAKKFFGSTAVVGKTLTLSDRYTCTVTGVVEDFPANSHFQADVILNINMFQSFGIPFDSWQSMINCYTYLLLKDGTDVNGFAEKIRNVYRENIPGESAELYLQPLSKIHFGADLIYDYAIRGDKRNVYLFSSLAVLILGIACINFVNLSIASSAYRLKEIGMRKVSGAKRIDIIKQYIGETGTLVFAALAAALFLVEMFLPALNSFSGKQLSFGLSGIFRTGAGILLLAATVSLAAGLYPALFLSSFHPAGVLKGCLPGFARKGRFRKMMVTFQFGITIFLLICTVSIHSQLRYIKNKDLGFDKSNIIQIGLISDKVKDYHTLKQQLTAIPGVEYVAKGFKPVYQEIGSSADVTWEGKENAQNIMFQRYNISYDYLDLFRIELLEGRNFSEKFTSDTANYILNQEAVRQMNITEPVGKRFSYNGKEGEIIGIVKDFHHGSLYNRIQPVILQLDGALGVNIRISPEDSRAALVAIEAVFKEANPDEPFDFKYLDETINAFYSGEQQTMGLFGSFTVLAICLSCMGLLGLAWLATQKRMKEFGIRKALGAETTGIVLKTTTEFILQVITGNVLAWPAAYIIVTRWLANFEYRAALPLWAFILSGLAVYCVSGVTVSLLVVRAAQVNPAKALRYE